MTKYRPSSPKYPPKYHVYFHHQPADLLNTFGFRHPYAAQLYINEVLDNYDHTWLNETTIKVESNGHTLTIKCNSLEDILEYDPKPKEIEEFIPQHPDTVILEYLKHFDRYQEQQPEEPKAPIVKSEPKTHKPPKRHKTTKQSQEGYISIPELANEYDIQPNKARNLLRKANIQKPQNGWTFKTDDPILKQIRKVLSAG